MAPSLIAVTHAAPRWQSANQPPYSFEGVLALAPDCTASHLTERLDQHCRQRRRLVGQTWERLRQLQEDILATLSLGSETQLLPQMQTEFAALGYAYLQIQLLTQKLRYTSNLDQLLFDTQVDQAATAALAGDIGQAQQMLQSCFDQLGQERDHYYSLDVSLLDVTLLAETTLGATVAKQLGRDLPTHFCGQRQSPPTDALEASRDRTSAAASVGRPPRQPGRRLDIERPHPL